MTRQKTLIKLLKRLIKQDYLYTDEKLREMIVDSSGDLPRIELFARHKFKGWDTWGNQVEEKNTLEEYFV